MCNRGFTLVELLISAVIIGILTSISMRTVNIKERAYKALMQSDLRNIATAQEAFFEQSIGQPGGPRYASSIPQLNFTPSEGVIAIMMGGTEGWTAQTKHNKVKRYSCAIFMGDPNPPYAPAQVEGVLHCGSGMGKGKGGPPK